MIKAINYFLMISFALAVQQTFAQKKEIKSYNDLPVLNFSTEALHPDDTANVNVWMKNMAAKELLHIDSIESNYRISDVRMQINLAVGKVICDFIVGNWGDLKNADTAFNQISALPPYMRQSGLVELAVYAKVMLQSSVDFNKSYIPILKTNLESFSKEDRLNIITDIVKRTSNLSNGFSAEIKSAKASPVVGDTSLIWLFVDYGYVQFKENSANLLFEYANKLESEKYTRADTLRGTINAERSWWDVLRYDITIKPDYAAKSTIGKNNIQYKVVSDNYPLMMQIDLQEPLLIDSIFFNSITKLQFTKDGNAWHVAVPKQKKGSVNNLLIYYSGKAHEATRPPWDGGWTWIKDSIGNPYMEVTCQGIGASIWFPCKDHQSDEPDNGASLSVIVPDSLMAVGNGRLQSTSNNHDGTTTYKWAVVNPINNYDIIPYIGKYSHFSDQYKGEKGNLDINYWVLNYNTERAKLYLIPEVNKMLKAHEYWFGPYPFYEDGYKLAEAPAGMEHQSDIAYSNGYHYGSEHGYDYSGSGWGMKWDYIIVHESAHEWFGNNITTKDIADMWVHEGFACYSETLYTEYWFGKSAGNEYNYGLRGGIGNTFPVIGNYGVNDDISARNQDMYPKGANMLHTIRHSMDNDSSFRMILRGLNKTFYHQTVTSSQIEKYISQQAGYDYSKVFDQYLRNIKIPQLEFYFSADKKKVFYRYDNCINGFNLPLALQNENAKIRIIPTKEWSSKTISDNEAVLFNSLAIEKMYYIEVKEVSGK